MHRESWQISQNFIIFKFSLQKLHKKPYEIILLQNAHKLGTCGMDYTFELVGVLQDSYLSTSWPHTFSQRVVRRPTSASSLSKSEWGPRWVGRDFSTNRRALCTSSVSWSITICCCDTEFWRFSKSSWTCKCTVHPTHYRDVQTDVRGYGNTGSSLTAKTNPQTSIGVIIALFLKDFKI